MNGRNDKANNRYGLRNCKHINHNDGLSISGQGSGDKEEAKRKKRKLSVLTRGAVLTRQTRKMLEK